jgi:GNAT superfamily N-acetyltransferase
MKNTKNVALACYSEAYDSSIHSYTLPEEQLIYTALPAEALANCEQEKDRTPVLILAENKLAGFFVLDAGEAVKEYTESSGALLIRSYSIHPDYQGKGVGKKSLKLLPSFINHHFPTKNEVVLGVNFKKHGRAASVQKKRLCRYRPAYFWKPRKAVCLSDGHKKSLNKSSSFFLI